MRKALLLALSNPVSEDREEEFNTWYNTVHAAQLLTLPGFRKVSRYRASTQLLPGAEKPTYTYLAVYEVDDSVAAVKTVLENDSQFQMSDAMDFGGALGIAFDEIYCSDDVISK